MKMNFVCCIERSDLLLLIRAYCLRLSRFFHPCSVASFSEIGLTTSCPLSSSISTLQGAPILNGKVVSSLTLVGTKTRTLEYSFPLLAVFLPIIVPVPVSYTNF